MNLNEDAKKFINKHRLELAKHFLERSDHSAEILRGFLFTVATAAIGFIMHEQKGALGGHVWSLTLLGFSALLVFVSWSVQKDKAIKRFEALRDGKTDYDANLRTWYRRNASIDIFAFALIAFAVVIEVVIRLNGPA